MPDLPFTPQLFAILSALIEERTGIHYSLEDKDLLGDKLSSRAAEAGFDSLLDYYYVLRYDPASQTEFDALIDALVVGETYFFRELPALQVLAAEFLAQACASGRARVWSAACATGEEPLTLAMLLAEQNLLDRVEIVASDISLRSLDRARAGIYGRRAVRDAPPPQLVLRWLREAGGRWETPPDLRQSVTFRRVNLTDDAQVSALGSFNAILCRNVLIYYSEATARQVVERLARALVPGGILLVGVSESLLRFSTTLACEEHRGVFVYRKPGP